MGKLMTTIVTPWWWPWKWFTRKFDVPSNHDEKNENDAASVNRKHYDILERNIQENYDALRQRIQENREEIDNLILLFKETQEQLRKIVKMNRNVAILSIAASILSVIAIITAIVLKFLM